MVNVQVQSTGNKIRNCTAMEGAIFKFDRTEFTDDGSIFEYNGADRGGVAFCTSCKMTFKNSVFKGNYAKKGGIFYIENWGELVLENVQIISSRAFEAGGLVYAEGQKADLETKGVTNYVGAVPTVNFVKYVKITIQQVAQPDPLLPQPPLDFKNFESLQNGAAVFIKNGELNVNDMVIDLVDS